MRRDEALRQRIAQRLAAWPVQGPMAAAGVGPGEALSGGLHEAAVALVVVDAGFGAGLADVAGLPALDTWCDDAALLLTRRAAGLRRHAGQWALPGGRVDAGETPEATALRELAEEVGLQLAPADLLGRLDSFATRSGYAITPVVAWGGRAEALSPNPDEVAGVHRIPFSELLRPDAPILEPLAGSAHPVLKMPVGDSWIAAPTAALLYQFREVCLLGRDTRVAHYEQPRFAWR